jgi:hypothetical protein
MGASPRRHRRESPPGVIWVHLPGVIGVHLSGVIGVHLQGVIWVHLPGVIGVHLSGVIGVHLPGVIGVKFWCSISNKVAGISRDTIRINFHIFANKSTSTGAFFKRIAGLRSGNFTRFFDIFFEEIRPGGCKVDTIVI